MPSKGLEFSDMSYELSSSQQDSKGCHVSVVLGFVFVLLGGLIAVGVGVIVHFAGGSREVVCKCDYASGAAEVLQHCVTLASIGNAEICEKCPATTTAGTATTTSGHSTGNTTLRTTDQTTVATTQKPAVVDVRLPTSLYPDHYDIEIQTYMNTTKPEDFAFKGRVKIRLRCVNATDRITLHALDLKVVNESVKVVGDSLDPVTVLGYDVDEARQFIIILLDKVLQVNKTYEIEMSYTARITNSLVGLYYSGYKRNKETVYLATTSFQPTDARRVFPCFDEPALKSTFNVTLVRPANRISLSNMELIDSSETFVDGSITYVKDVFGQSPIMSGYLLVIAICDFDYLEQITDKNVTFRTYAVKELVNTTQYSLDIGVRLLGYFEDFFNISYTLPKLGMIAFPDFVSGAMEHWGLISYSERNMLYKEGETSESSKEMVASVVSHELAHMWFGNLVTMSWWDDLWLNEGFASFVEFFGVDHIHPDWNIFASFLVNDVHSAFASDGRVSSHPLYVPVYHPDEIMDIFDTISYSKGAAVIRMMRHFLGFETFRKGMNLYLNSRAYGSAFHDDLWNILAQQAKMENKSIDAKSIMDTWILQMNYPVVTVSRVPDTLQLLVQQDRFLEDRNVSEVGKYESPFNYTWIIPLTITTNETRNFSQTDQDIIWMWTHERSRLINLTANPNGWVLANLEQNGYYRVNYDLDNWKGLTDQLQQNHTIIPVINRAQIINDAWNLAKAKYLPLEVAFSTLDYLDEETDYQPWQAVRRELTYMDRMLSVNSVYRVFQQFLQCKLEKPYLHFGLNNTGFTHLEILASTVIAGQACKYGIDTCMQEASKQYKNWMNDNRNTINTNIRSIVYCYAISMGGFDEWSFAFKKYNETELATERSNLLTAMSCTRQPWILNHFMSLILTNDSVIRHHERLTVLSSVASTSTGRSLAWNFYRAHYNTLKTLYSSSTKRWLNIVDSVTRSLNTPFELEEVKSFKLNQGNNVADITTALNEAIDTVTANIKWLESYQGEIEQIILKKLAETPDCGAPTKSSTNVHINLDL